MAISIDIPILTRFQSVLNLVAAAAVVLSPALILSMRGGTGYCFFVVFALALAYLARRANRRAACRVARANRGFCLALLGLPCVVVFQLVVLRTGRLPELDPLLRLALAVPSFLFLASLPSRALRQVQWGFVIGALGVGAWAVYASFHPAVWYGPGRLGNAFTNPIPFGDTALMLGFLSIASLDRRARVRPAEVAIKVLALVAGAYASYLSGSRGGWIAVPWLIWATVAGHHWLRSRRARIALAVILAAVVVSVAFTNVVRQRVAAIGTDVAALQRGHEDTSVGARLDLWRASLRIYVAHPLVGVGRGDLAAALQGLADKGEVPRAIVNGRAHSEFFSVLAETGSLGVAALLLLYGGTLLPFWRRRRHADPDIASAAYLGLALVGGTILFGLTIDVMTLVMNTAFFALTAVTLLASIDARRRELGEA